MLVSNVYSTNINFIGKCYLQEVILQTCSFCQFLTCQAITLPYIGRIRNILANVQECPQKVNCRFLGAKVASGTRWSQILSLQDQPGTVAVVAIHQSDGSLSLIL